MKPLLRALLACGALALLGGAASPVPFTLKGQWTQGGLIVGKTRPGAKVWLDGREVSVAPDGRFVFGLDRDASLKAELKLEVPGTAPVTRHYKVKKRKYDIQTVTGLPPEQVTPPPEALERIKRDAELSRAARERNSAREDLFKGFTWPCTGRISGVFGSQRILNGVPKQPHYGVDVAVPIGTPVHAPQSGVVSLASPDMYYTGGTVMIDHGYGVTSTLMHLSKVLVKEGDEVKQGQVVAESGMTGRANGPHLDWRVSWFDTRVDAQLLAGPMPDAEKK